MSHPELLLISILRAVIEVALLTLVGQAVLAVFAGAKRDGNPVYRLFVVITNPAVRLVRAMTPRIVLDRHIPYVTFFLLFWLWIALAYWRQHYCAAEQLQCV
jgi:uncharacterized protein YggT (Ycf19 family)